MPANRRVAHQAHGHRHSRGPAGRPHPAAPESHQRAATRSRAPRTDGVRRGRSAIASSHRSTRMSGSSTQSTGTSWTLSTDASAAPITRCRNQPGPATRGQPAGGERPQDRLKPHARLNRPPAQRAAAGCSSGESTSSLHASGDREPLPQSGRWTRSGARTPAGHRLSNEERARQGGGQVNVAVGQHRSVRSGDQASRSARPRHLLPVGSTDDLIELRPQSAATGGLNR